MEGQKGEIILYQREDGAVQIDVRVEDETVVWLTQEQMAALFGKGRSTITEHISHIFEEGELDENVVCRNFRQTTQHGAIEEREMRMTDFVRELDNILRTTGRNVLDNAGQISNEQAKKKAIEEYKKYKAKTLSNVEKDYLNSITMLEQKAKKANRIKQ